MDLGIRKSIGIIACPGGKNFARAVRENLNVLFKNCFSSNSNKLKAQFEIERDAINKFSKIAKIFNEGVKFNNPDDLEVPVKFTKFANGEFKAEILSTIRDKEIYIVQDVANIYPLSINDEGESEIISVNDHIMSLITTIDACIQAKCRAVNVILPTYPYSRQDKRHSREGLTASVIGRILEDMGVKHILTLDIHSKCIENIFRNLAFENLNASYEILQALSNVIDIDDPELVVVSPDTGAVNRNKFFASSLKRPLAMLYKERDYSKVSLDAIDSNVALTRLLGDVEGKNVLMTDDMLATGGTLIKAMKLLKYMGAKKIICAISLPFFNGSAIKHFDKAFEEGYFYKIIGTNAVYHNDLLRSKEWYYETDVSELFAQAIFIIYNKLSLSGLLDRNPVIQELLKSD